MRFAYLWFVLAASCADGVVGVPEDRPDITIPSEDQESASAANGDSSTATTSGPAAADERAATDAPVTCDETDGCSEPACADSAACRCTTVTLVSGSETGVDGEPLFGLADRTPVGTVIRGTGVELLRFWLQPNPDCEPGISLDRFTVKLVVEEPRQWEDVELELWDRGISTRLETTDLAHGLVANGLQFRIEVVPYMLGLGGGPDRHEFSVRSNTRLAPSGATVSAVLVSPVRWHTLAEPGRVLETQDFLPVAGEMLTVASE